MLAANDLRSRIAVLMGGRAAEQLIFDGNVSSSAADDLQHATQIAAEMVTRYGMDATLGQRTYSPQPTFLTAQRDQAFQASEITGRQIDLAVRSLPEAGGASPRAILERHRSELKAGVALLLSKETLMAEEFAPLRPVAEAA